MAGDTRRVDRGLLWVLLKWFLLWIPLLVIVVDMVCSNEETEIQMNMQAAKEEYERLCGWRERWLKLANNTERMRNMGGLQSQMEYVCYRSQRANLKIGTLLREYRAEQGKKIALETAQFEMEKERAEYQRLKAKFEVSNT